MRSSGRGPGQRGREGNGRHAGQERLATEVEIVTPAGSSETRAVSLRDLVGVEFDGEGGATVWEYDAAVPYPHDDGRRPRSTAGAVPWLTEEWYGWRTLLAAAALGFGHAERLLPGNPHPWAAEDGPPDASGCRQGGWRSTGVASSMEIEPYAECPPNTVACWIRPPSVAAVRFHGDGTATVLSAGETMTVSEAKGRRIAWAAGLD